MAEQNTKIIKGKKYYKVKQIDPNRPPIFTLKSNKKSNKKTPKLKKFAGGGMTTKGLGRAFMKGGKV